jgi:hypothetical protein
MPRNLRNSILTLLLMGMGVLSAQSVYTFTPCGAVQRYGPTQIQADAAYTSTNLAGNVTVVNGIQYWVVPLSGDYEIQAFGGQGYGAFGGRGAHMTGEFSLTAGDTLKILVGQYAGPYLNFPAATYNHQFGGGGGSFVTTPSNIPLIVAGGGGGNHGPSFLTACDGQITTSGSIGALGTTVAAGGVGGAGGMAASSADGGGGFTGNGAGIAGGLSFTNGGVGGADEGIGGFGCGGGTSSWNNYRGGGGGGYSGGGAGNNGANCCAAGGGGGSFNAGTNQANLAGVQLGDGSVVIRQLSLPPNDGGVAAIMGFTPPVCAGTYPVNVVLRNYGSNQISPITVRWTINGIPQPDSVISTVLDTLGSAAGDSLNVLLGNITITSATTIRVWTTLPNSTTDPTSANDTTEISIAAPAIVSAALDSDADCNGAATGGASASGIGGSPAYSYLWSNGSTTGAILNVAAGNYIVTLTDGDGCTDTASVSIGEPSAIAVIDSVWAVTCNGSSDGAISLIPSGGTPGYSILWANSDTSWAISGLAGGSYAYTITDANGCMWSDSIAVAEPTALAFSTVVTDETAPGNGAVDLTVSGGTAGYTYLWGNGATTQDLSGLIAGTYTVTITDANGCSDTTSVVVDLLIGIAGNAHPFTVSVSPNPSQGRFNVHITGAMGTSHVVVTDVVGRRVAMVADAAPSLEMNLQLDNGVYFVRVQNGEATRTVRVVIAH